MRGSFIVPVILIAGLAVYFVLGRQSQTIPPQRSQQQPNQPRQEIQTERPDTRVESRANAGTRVSWFTYNSQKPPYSIQYPHDFSLRKSGDEIVSIGGPLITLESDARTIALHVDPLLGDPTPSFEDWAKERAMLWCEADGPNGSSRCDSITKMSVFTTSGGNTGYEIYMHLVYKHYQDGFPTKSIVGPVFIFDVSRVAHQQREGLIIIDLPLKQISPQDLDTIRSIVTTLKF